MAYKFKWVREDKSNVVRGWAQWHLYVEGWKYRLATIDRMGTHDSYIVLLSKGRNRPGQVFYHITDYDRLLVEGYSTLDAAKRAVERRFGLKRPGKSKKVMSPFGL